jgi:hypothetical protein
MQWRMASRSDISDVKQHPLRLVLQGGYQHSEVYKNEEADKIAKNGAGEQCC